MEPDKVGHQDKPGRESKHDTVCRKRKGARQMTYNQLMSKINDGMMEVVSWLGTGCYDERLAEVIKWKETSGRPTRSIIRITKIPAGKEVA